MPTNAHIVDPQPNEVAAPQFAINGEIEQSQIAPTILKLQSNADCPDLPRFERALLADKASLVPGRFRKADERRDRGAHGSSLIPTAPTAAPLIR